jgi:hypothetical protein
MCFVTLPVYNCLYEDGCISPLVGSNGKGLPVIQRKFSITCVLLIFLSSCAVPAIEKTATPVPPVPPAPLATTTKAVTATPSVCDRQGTIGSDHVPAPTQGFEIYFRYYLPPCYDAQTSVRFPVIYLMLMPFERQLDATSQAPMSLAERLIHAGRMPPAIIVVPDDTAAYGYHVALAKDLIPYVDAKFRTLADRRQRGVGGISHAAAISARMAFEFPGLFGSVGLLSGGIDPTEMERFDGWIARTPVDERPRVLIKVGEQDSIRSLTAHFLDVLDRNRFPYTLELSQGGHTWAYWSAQIETYLLWFSEAW